MPTTGDQTADVWDAEYRSAGQVVFPVRRSPAVLRVVLIGVLTVLQIASMATSDQAVAWWVIDWLILTMATTALTYCLWQLATRRPKVVVDREGIRKGRKLITWSTITTLDFSASATGLRIRSEAPPKRIFIPRDNVRDLAMGRAWLQHLLEFHRNSGSQQW
ncbi:hypothetical protein GCM10029976_079890 [Kribbella albertanoniae]|uniref:PH domain-containing protein n=1 Tax=Kribbella albertanoniae TaxID=1266829 RepID=A0A4V6PA21_9ACTN|nr:hypothetical protein [Kribbella albertanoniae]TDC14106.1 hypothetical protein E1261_44270 [Kribbella albertanoniae]